MKIEPIIFSIILVSAVISGCVKSLDEEYSQNFKSISDQKPSEFKSKNFSLIITHQPKKSEYDPLVKELHIFGNARYEGNTTLTYFNIKVQFYDKKGSLICEKTSDVRNLKIGEIQSFDLKVTGGDCKANWGFISIERYKLGIKYFK